MTKQQPENDKLIHGYNRMMERVKTAFEKVGHETPPRLRQAIEYAKEKAVELEELTLEEAERIGDYLRRDVEDAAEYLAGENTEELKAWFRFDVARIEEQLLELFLSVADRASLDLFDLEEQLVEASEYHSGEITGPGSLVCMNCGTVLHFHKTSHITPCSKCHETAFVREGSL